MTPIERKIEKLVADNQPFILIRYEEMFCEDYNSRSYELVTWQNRDQYQPSMVMDSNLFRKIIKDYDLQLLESSEMGRVYGIDNRLQQLSREFNRAVDPLKKRYHALKFKFLGDKKNKSIIQEYKKAYRELREFERLFMEKNNIKKIR